MTAATQSQGAKPMETHGREISPETFSRLTDTDLSVVMDWINGRSTVRFDERDLVRYSRRCVRIIYQLPNAAGKGKRPRMAESIHKSSRRRPVDVDPIEYPRIPSMAHPSPEDVEGDASFSVVTGEGMPEGFQVLERNPRRGRRPSKAAHE